MEDTKTLVYAARKTGVGQVVHIIITNPSSDSSFPYFNVKAQVEEAIIVSGIPYAIVQPTVILGLEDILINNIAWPMRRFPLFVVPGWGEYRFQPILVEDLAELAVNAGEEKDHLVHDAT